jgi:SNF2 family DNA or RNA helicase
MEMRLGKTLVAIRWALHWECSRILIVAPLPVLPVWEEELGLEGCNDVVRVVGTKEQKLHLANDPHSRWFVINYEGLRTCQQLTDTNWDAIILDESTRIRNPKAKTTKIICNQFRHVHHKAILSGLPAPEGPLDYFCQMEFLKGHWAGCANYWQFRHQYFHTDQRGWTWDPNPGVMTAIKKQVHLDAYVLTRRQAGIGSKKIYSKRYVEMTPEQNKETKSIKKWFETHMDGQVKLTQHVIVQMQWLSRVAGGITKEGAALSNRKILELRSLLIDGELRDEQVVIWFRYNAELKVAYEHMTNLYGLKSAMCITGKTKMEDRHFIIRNFQKGAIRVLFLQVKVGKFGLDLASSSTAIYYSNSYDMEDRAQSEERIISPKKVDPVLYIDLISRGSIDEDVRQLLREKKSESKFFMGELVRRWRQRAVIDRPRTKRDRMGSVPRLQAHGGRHRKGKGTS